MRISFHPYISMNNRDSHRVFPHPFELWYFLSFHISRTVSFFSPSYDFQISDSKYQKSCWTSNHYISKNVTWRRRNIDPHFHFMTFMSATNKIFFGIRNATDNTFSYSFYYNSRQQLKNIQGSHRNFSCVLLFPSHVTSDGLRQKSANSGEKEKRKNWRGWGMSKNYSFIPCLCPWLDSEEKMSERSGEGSGMRSDFSPDFFPFSFFIPGKKDADKKKKSLAS